MIKISEETKTIITMISFVIIISTVVIAFGILIAEDAEKDCISLGYKQAYTTRSGSICIGYDGTVVDKNKAENITGKNETKPN